MTQFDLNHTSINDSYALENLLFSSRTADAFRGVDLSRNVAITILLSRGAFVRHSQRMAQFLERLEALEKMQPPPLEMLAFGADRSGVGFLVLPILDGSPAIHQLREASEVERRFIRITKFVEQVHSANIICGDLSKYSFWLNRSGEISFVGAFGPDPGEVGDRIQTVTSDVSGFCAPELFRNESLSIRSDVYSLGTLCYFLLTGTTPPTAGSSSAAEFSLAEHLPAAVASSSAVPIWAEEVLRVALSPDPGQRYENASTMLAALLTIKEKSVKSTNMPVKSNQVLLPDRSQQQQILVRNKPKLVEAADEDDQMEAPPKRRYGLAAVVSVIVLACGVWASRMLNTIEEEEPEPEVVETPAHQALHEGIETDRPLKEVLNELERNPTGIAENKERLKGLVSSDDPVAHDTLVRLAMRATSVELRKTVEISIIERARRLGAVRSAEEIRTWLLEVNEQIPECYEPILRALDHTLPQDAIERYLRQAYTKAPATVLRITVALGFDSKDINKYHSLLAQLIGDSLKLSDSKEHSASALILADPTTSAVFADDVIQNIASIPDNDIQWLLDLLALRRDPNIKVIAHNAIDRNLLQPGKKVFAVLLRDRDDISAALSVSLVNAVAGTISDADISQIGNWYDVQSEIALYGIMATSTDTHILGEAFDTVAGKAKQGSISDALIGRIRSDYWQDRVKFAHFLGVISLATEFSEEQISSALDEVDALINKDTQFIDALLLSSDPRVVRAVINRYPGQLGAGRLINLLSSAEGSVKIAAIHMLKDYNQIQLLQLIIEAYKSEKDPEIRKEYQETFWFIKQREQAGTL